MLDAVIGRNARRTSAATTRPTSRRGPAVEDAAQKSAPIASGLAVASATAPAPAPVADDERQELQVRHPQLAEKVVHALSGPRVSECSTQRTLVSTPVGTSGAGTRSTTRVCVGAPPAAARKRSWSPAGPSSESPTENRSRARKLRPGGVEQQAVRLQPVAHLPPSGQVPPLQTPTMARNTPPREPVGSPPCHSKWVTGPGGGREALWAMKRSSSLRLIGPGRRSRRSACRRSSSRSSAGCSAAPRAWP